MSVRVRLESIRGTPLYRASGALILTTGLNAVLGLLFWVSAARLYSTGVVGVGAAAISAMTLVSSLGWVGLQFVLMRFIPVAGARRAELVLVTYAVALAIALPAAVAFLLLGAEGVGLGLLAENGLGAAAFVASVAVWSLFSLQDAVLIGLRRSTWVPVENAAFGALKLGLIVVLSGAASAWALFGGWVASAALFVGLVNAALFRRILRDRATAPAALPPPRRMVGFAAGHHAAAVIAAIPDALVPLLVLTLSAPEDNAFYYAAWTVSFSLRLVAVNLTNALTVEGANEQERLWGLVRSVVRLGAAILVPLALVALVGAAPIMSLFGREYAGAAADVLRFFVLGLIPFAVVTLVIAIERVRQRTRAAFAILAVSTVVTIGLDLWLIPRLGIEGAALGWLAAQLAAATLGLLLLAREERRPRPRQRSSAAPSS